MSRTYIRVFFLTLIISIQFPLNTFAMNEEEITREHIKKSLDYDLQYVEIRRQIQKIDRGVFYNGLQTQKRNDLSIQMVDVYKKRQELNVPLLTIDLLSRAWMSNNNEDIISYYKNKYPQFF